MDIETKIDLIKRPPTEEIIQEDDLRELLSTNDKPSHYIGFEISGLLHLGTLIICGDKINDLCEAGINCTVYLADWHSFINKKLGGNWDSIIKASKYYEKAFRFYCPKANILLGSKFYEGNDEYWKDVMRFASQITYARTVRTLTIMGRSEKEELSMAQYFYPIMQAVDVKHIGKDIAHGGMDQRKIHVLCREVFPKLGWKKPIAIHHHLLPGLAEPPKINTKDKMEMVVAVKMSKSKPWTAIYIHDSEEEIRKKLRKAWCPERQVEMNPVLEIAKYIVFRRKESLIIERESKYGGTIEINSYKELEEKYSKGEIHPLDLKEAIARELNLILEPIRKYFEIPENKELVDTIKKFEITR
ncbi:MAG: tyrosine--tRNA ligase [Thermoproteota archaeon]|jgi:tyrosyl-tRNA synthetase|nr:tyrosine--tRNA ligase [Thermoproteota archaeon]